MADFVARIKPKKSSVSGEVPAALDLDVAELAVNTADGKLFVKHTDNSIKEISGGGGGATSIQAQDDFELNSNPPVTTTWLGKWYRSNAVSGACQQDTYIGPDSDGAVLSREDIDGDDYESTVTGINGGTTLYVRVNSGAWQEFILDAASSTNCSASIDSFVIESTVLKTVIDNASEDDLIEISDGTDAATDIQLVDGDILQWNNADQKFKPAQLPVDSVNGETGVVSLGIQDMNDFQVVASSTSASHRFTYNASNSVGTGEWSPHSFLDLIYLNPTDADGNDITANANWNDTGTVRMWVSEDSGTTWEHWEGTIFGPNGSGDYQMQGMDDGSINITTTGDLLWSIGQDPPAGGSPVLEDGDMIIWDTTIQKFKQQPQPSTVTTVAMADITEAANPSDGAVLQYSDQDTEWKKKTISQMLAGSIVTSGGGGGSITASASTGPTLLGGNAFYADNAAMVADGWNVNTSLTNVDDSSIDLSGSGFTPTVPTAYETVAYLGETGLGTLTHWRVNTNGAVYAATAFHDRAGRSGNAGTDAGSDVELYLPFFSQDNRLRRCGWKENTGVDGTDWLVIRADFQVRYNDTDDGFACEAWFGKNGKIRMYWGPRIGADGGIIDITGTTHHINNEGTSLYDFNTLLNMEGDVMIEFAGPGVPTTSGTPGALLSDVSDVSTNTPTDGQALVWNNTASEWQPVAVLSLADLKTEVAAATDFADFQSRIAALGSPS